MTFDFFFVIGAVAVMLLQIYNLLKVASAQAVVFWSIMSKRWGVNSGIIRAEVHNRGGTKIEFRKIRQFIDFNRF